MVLILDRFKKDSVKNSCGLRLQEVCLPIELISFLWV